MVVLVVVEYMHLDCTLPQNMLMASGGKPRRRRAVSVNSRGSSQSLYSNNHKLWPLRQQDDMPPPIAVRLAADLNVCRRFLCPHAAKLQAASVPIA